MTDYPVNAKISARENPKKILPHSMSPAWPSVFSGSRKVSITGKIWKQASAHRLPMGKFVTRKKLQKNLGRTRTVVDLRPVNWVSFDWASRDISIGLR
jgi:hypothetical protein